MYNDGIKLRKAQHRLWIGGFMLEVYLNNKVVFIGTDEEVEKYCNNNEWDYTQNPSYADFEKMCGIYC